MDKNKSDGRSGLEKENADLRFKLEAASDKLVEAAIDAGQLHARIEILQAELIEVRTSREAWRIEAMRLRGTAARMA